MWLRSTLPRLARLAAAIYYRIEYAGAAVPPRGPVLLVANHPNSLLDPMLVLAASGRPLRFLAKAPLFEDPKVGWLVRAFGSIPVYRAADDPSRMARNDEMFRAVHAALAAGDAVALFPEGISHSEPALAPLKTGAARIAIGSSALVGGAFPLVPVGLVFRDKERFRSRAQVVVGDPVRWDDLAGRGVHDPEAVRELTERVARALAALTVNLESWLDAPVVDTAMAIWAAEEGRTATPPEEAAWRGITARLLATVRALGDAEGEQLVRDVSRHARRLARLHLAPGDLHADTDHAAALRWSAARLPVVMPLPLLVAAAGWVLFWVPYRLTGWVVGRFPLAPDTRSTWKLLVGAGVYLVWLVVLAVVVGLGFRWYIGMLVLLAAPGVGMLGLRLREHWRGSWRDLRRWLLLRSRRRLVAGLRDEQRALHARLGRLLERLAPHPQEAHAIPERRSQ